MKFYDLRSDTVTRPSDAMRRAMYDAEVGDDVYGEDPTVNELEELAAEILGKPRALFVTSGSMGNLIPAILNCGRGNEIVAEENSHGLHYELASMTAIAGAMPVGVPGERGVLSAEALEARIRPSIYYMCRTRLIVLENTHNLAGGTFYPEEALKEIWEMAGSHGLSVHIDGARLFNAAAASDVPARRIAGYANTVTFCLSKGLGAPVGSMLCGEAAFVSEARRVRKQLGGGMRQAGVLAAAGIYALNNNVDRIPEDHRNARRIAEALADTTWAQIDPGGYPSNILYFRAVGRPAIDIVDALKAAGVLCSAVGDDTVRLVTHLDISSEDTAQVCQILKHARL